MFLGDAGHDGLMCYPVFTFGVLSVAYLRLERTTRYQSRSSCFTLSTSSSGRSVMWQMALRRWPIQLLVSHHRFEGVLPSVLHDYKELRIRGQRELISGLQCHPLLCLFLGLQFLDVV